MKLPKLSIVTPSFNQGQFLEKTIKSVLDQGHSNLEYLVVDGGSSDNSVEIIRRYEKHLAYWVSEPDRGQAHAINKGLACATGDIFAFINSDDLYLPGAFSAVVDYFQQHPDCDWLCGDTVMFGEGHAEEVIRARVPKSAAHCLAWSYNAPQPGMFWKRKLLTGGFDEQWRYCFDHELYVRLLLAGHRCHYLPRSLGAYRLHGESKTVAEATGFDREFDAIAEMYEGSLACSGRRWVRATQLLRRSYSSSEAGDIKAAATCLIRGAATYPKCFTHRPFWGCLNQMLKRGLTL